MSLFAKLVLLILGLSQMALAADLKIYWVDVEGGGATLIITPAGESILIDAGEKQRDADRIYDVATKIAGIKQIDYMVITHWHADHYGGVSYLTKTMPVKSFYAPEAPPTGVPEDTAYDVLMPQYRAAVGDRTIVLSPGKELPLRQVAGTSLSATILAAGRQQLKPATATGLNPACRNLEPTTIDSTQNSKSLVVLFRYGGFTFFNGGDLTRDREKELVCPINLVGQVSIYQTDHHGLDLSNNPVLIRSIDPQVVIINNGPTKGPENETMATLLQAKGIKTIWQIHHNLKPGDQLNADPQYTANMTEGTSQFLRAVVQRNGTFRIGIGSSSQGKTYTVRE